MQVGTIRYFDPVNGHGAIIPPDGSRDLHFRDCHIATGSQPLRMGDRVTFHHVTGKRVDGNHVANVRSVDAD